MTRETEAATSHTSPIWANKSNKSFVTATWVATGETPEWIARRTDALLTRLGNELGIAGWGTATGHSWEGSNEAKVAIVRSHPVRETIAEGVDGEALAGEGYSMVLMGSAPKVSVNITINAGSIGLGRRIPAHQLRIDLRQNTAGGVTAELGDQICAAVASIWKPSILWLTDAEVNRAARRGGWKIGVGYRTWISDEVGQTTDIAAGLSRTRLADGTLIAAPDDWPASDVVAAMEATLALNNLDDIPH